MADKDITLADVYHRIGSLEAKVEQAIGLEDRVRSLEVSRGRIRGIAGAVSVGCSAAVTMLASYFFK